MNPPVPKVSVCIPTYNTAQYLPAAIESVLAQDYGDFELVVSDNASTDQTPDLCRRYADPRLRYVRFEEMVGQAANWNRCLDLATGEYVVLLHADDVVLPGFVRQSSAVLDGHPNVGLVHCAVQHIAPDGSPLHLQTLYPEDQIDAGHDRFRQLLMTGCLINPAGVMVRRSAYTAVGRFTEDVVWGVDWHMWLRLALHTDVAYLAEPLACYRQHAQSGTSGVMTSARYGPDELWALDDVFRRLPAADLKSLYPKARQRVAHRTWCHAEAMCRLGHRAAARRGLRAAGAVSRAVWLKPRTWALWGATFCGYRWFDRLARLRGSRRVAGSG
jgi:glycosyltransferase involved in cell wall biosynthesis